MFVLYRLVEDRERADFAVELQAILPEVPLLLCGYAMIGSRILLQTAALLANIQGMLASPRMFRTIKRVAVTAAFLAVCGLWVSRYCCPERPPSGDRSRRRVGPAPKARGRTERRQ